METAVNIYWDSQANKKDKILIVGLGSVGLLTAYYFLIKRL
jgi:threonine dehydrogenase-like Zn-dependent dehydrogenase